MYTSEQAAVAAIVELGNGWVVLPYDEPHRGVLGYCAIERDPQDGAEPQEHVFQWAIHGHVLDPEVELVEAADLAAFVRSEPADQLHRCDDAKRRQFGFVSFRLAAEGRAIVRQTTLTKFKEASRGVQEFLVAERDRRDTAADRIQAAEALGTHQPVEPDPLNEQGPETD